MYGQESAGIDDTRRGAAMAIGFSGRLGGILDARLAVRFGIWLVDNGFNDQAIKEYAKHGAVRVRWLANLDRKLADCFPVIGGF